MRKATTPLTRAGADMSALLADMFALRADVGQHLRGECGQFGGAQTLQVLGFDRMQIEHAAIVQTCLPSRHWVFFQLPSISRSRAFHIRVMRLS